MTKIILFGDPDSTSDAEDIYSAIDKEENVDLYFNLGDNFYHDTWDKGLALLRKHFPDGSEKKNKFVLSLGNHEHEESEDPQAEKEFGAWLPEQYKSKPEFDSTDQSWENTRWLTSRQVGDIFVICMNSQDMDVEFKRNQYNWVMQQLEIAKSLRAQGKIKWIIGGVHKPWFTLKSSHSPYTAVREIYSDPFKNVVNQMWHGHNHNDQAWWSMIAKNESGNAAGEQLQSFLADGKTIDHSKEHGWTTNINGHSGHEHNKFKENATANKNVQWANDKIFSYAVLESNGDILNTKWKDKSGQVLYEYNISMSGSGGPDPTPIEPTPVEPTPVEPTPVEPTPTEIKCPRNYELDPALGHCIPMLEPLLEPDCGEGWKWNPDKKICERIVVTPVEPGTDIDAVAPDVINAKVGETVVLDGSHSTGPIVKAEWNRQDNSGIPIILEPSTQKWSSKFVATQAMVGKEIKYTLRVFDQQGNQNDDIPNGTKVIVKPAGTGPDPTPIEPTPVESKILYDSNIHGKWNNGQKRTVTEGDGSQEPDGKGLHTAASGDPTLTIDGNGIAHLESSKWGRIYIYAKNYNFKLEGFFMFETDHGEDDNISIKLRSRHGNNNHPQGGSNEFGGIGFAFHPSGQVELAAEIQHGGSSYDFGNLQGPALKLNEWHKYTISGFDEGSGITVTVAIDDKNIGSKKWSNPHSTAKDKAAFDADSYFWIRLNCHDGDRAKAAIKDLKLYDVT